MKQRMCKSVLGTHLFKAVTKVCFKYNTLAYMDIGQFNKSQLAKKSQKS